MTSLQGEDHGIVLKLSSWFTVTVGNIPSDRIPGAMLSKALKPLKQTVLSRRRRIDKPYVAADIVMYLLEKLSPDIDAQYVVQGIADKNCDFTFEALPFSFNRIILLYIDSSMRGTAINNVGPVSFKFFAMCFSLDK